ncbi:MAG: hypothetical protein FWF53_04600 [Candidatus Azobacteroides sp.]|nr:hypothetical protein [Candidatus Azobacteroides sp.]
MKAITTFFMALAFCLAATHTSHAQSVEQFQFEVTMQAGETFAIPLGGTLGGNANNKSYNWNISWGDGNTETVAGTQTGWDSGGIPHSPNKAPFVAIKNQ